MTRTLKLAGMLIVAFVVAVYLFVTLLPWYKVGVAASLQERGDMIVDKLEKHRRENGMYPSQGDFFGNYSISGVSHVTYVPSPLRDNFSLVLMDSGVSLSYTTQDQNQKNNRYWETSRSSTD
jgi:hypothetical protein